MHGAAVFIIQVKLETYNSLPSMPWNPELRYRLGLKLKSQHAARSSRSVHCRDYWYLYLGRV
jgi:hypothetical protein